jgi:hypothetical protein
MPRSPQRLRPQAVCGPGIDLPREGFEAAIGEITLDRFELVPGEMLHAARARRWRATTARRD